jgi:hypothetical protein
VLRGSIQMDDAYLGREHTGGKTGRGSENITPIVAAVPLNRGRTADSRQNRTGDRVQFRGSPLMGQI